MTVSEWRKNND